MTKILTALILFTGLSASAYDNGPYPVWESYSTDVTCSELKRTIVEEGGALVVYSNPYIYSLYVTDRSHCGYNEVLERTSAPTADGRCRLWTCGQSGN